MSSESDRRRRESVEQIGGIISKIRIVAAESERLARCGNSTAFKSLKHHLEEFGALLASGHSQHLSNLDSEAPECFSIVVSPIPANLVESVSSAISAACESIDSWSPVPRQKDQRPDLDFGTPEEVTSRRPTNTEGSSLDGDASIQHIMARVSEFLSSLDNCRAYYRDQDTPFGIDADWQSTPVGLEFDEGRLRVRSIRTNGEVPFQSRLDFNVLRFIANRGVRWTTRDDLNDNWSDFRGSEDDDIRGSVGSCLTRLRRHETDLGIEITNRRGGGWQIQQSKVSN